MEQLTPMIGVWQVVSGIYLEGSWLEGPPTRAEIKPILGGKMLMEEGDYEVADRHFSPINIYSYDPFRKCYRIASLDDTSGLMDIYEGDFAVDTLRLTDEGSKTWYRRGDGSDVKFRVTYTLDDDRMQMVIEESPITGDTRWTPFMRIRYERAES